MNLFSTAFAAAIVLLAVSGVCAADFAAGQEAYSIGDYEKARAEWESLAAEGHAGAQFGMGLMYANGFGVDFDNAKALEWYTAAADQGHGEAQTNIAVMYANGWGVTQSDDEAFKWYSLAAESGVTQAQSSLAKMYVRGFGTPEDNVQAYKWYAIAAEIGDFGATFKRDEVAADLSAEEKAEAEAMVAAWLDEHPSLRVDQ